MSENTERERIATAIQREIPIEVRHGPLPPSAPYLATTRSLVMGQGLVSTESNSATIATPDGVDTWRDVEWEVDTTTWATVVYAAEGPPVHYRHIGAYVWERLT